MEKGARKTCIGQELQSVEYSEVEGLNDDHGSNGLHGLKNKE